MLIYKWYPHPRLILSHVYHSAPSPESPPEICLVVNPLCLRIPKKITCHWDVGPPCPGFELRTFKNFRSSCFFSPPTAPSPPERAASGIDEAQGNIDRKSHPERSWQDLKKCSDASTGFEKRLAAASGTKKKNWKKNNKSGDKPKYVSLVWFQHASTTNPERFVANLPEAWKPAHERVWL